MYTHTPQHPFNIYASYFHVLSILHFSLKTSRGSKSLTPTNQEKETEEKREKKNAETMSFSSLKLPIFLILSSLLHAAIGTYKHIHILHSSKRLGLKIFISLQISIGRTLDFHSLTNYTKDIRSTIGKKKALILIRIFDF